MTDDIQCSVCGDTHNIEDSEIGYSMPDDYFALSEADRELRGRATSNFCKLDNRLFIRSVAPVPVRGREQNYGWGVWVEVAEDDFQTAIDTWEDDDVSQLPRYRGKLANAVSEYENSIGLSGELELHSDHRPYFYASEGSRFHEDQSEGITEEDIARYIHRRA